MIDHDVDIFYEETFIDLFALLPVGNVLCEEGINACIEVF